MPHTARTPGQAGGRSVSGRESNMPRLRAETGDGLERLETECGAEAVLDYRPVARRQRSRRLGRVDHDLYECGRLTCACPVRNLDAAIGARDGEGVDDAEPLGDGDEVGAEARMAALHARFAVMPVVEHDDRQVAGLLGGDRR